MSIKRQGDSVRHDHSQIPGYEALGSTVQMRLQPTVASYFGYHDRVRNTLNQSHFDTMEQIINGGLRVEFYDAEIVKDLLSMHIIEIAGNNVKLNTAVFLEKDILDAKDLASEISQEMAELLWKIGSPFTKLSPEIRNFLAAVIGASQGISRLLRKGKLQVNWRDYKGEYAGTKVDFDEICPAYEDQPKDWLSKSTIKGNKYTAVFIGSGGGNFLDLISNTCCLSTARSYMGNLLRFLTDSYADLLAGNIDSEFLKNTVSEINIYENDKPRDILVTSELFDRFYPAIMALSEASSNLYMRNLQKISDLLRSTTAGRTGVPPENMMMHFARYCRRALAKELYESGFLTDKAREVGSITVFFENRIQKLVAFLS